MTAPSWHIVTSEYPPDLGGVSDFAAVLATVLPGEVHIWAPGAGGDRDSNVHRLGGIFDRDARSRFARELNRLARPRTLLLQWVPHGFGARSMNLPFCLWLWRRVRFHDDTLEIVVHEPFLSDIANFRQRVVALVHRVMVAVLINAARRVHVTIPAWEAAVSRYAGGRDLGFKVIPVPSRIAVVSDQEAVSQTRDRYAAEGNPLVGHFGACSGAMLPMLLATVPKLLREIPVSAFVLIGAGSSEARDRILKDDATLGGRLFATDALSEREVSLHLQACDMLVQPYPDGVSGRRTSAMSALRHGVPVVTTEGHLTEEIWTSSGAVVLAPAGDVEALVTATAKALGNAELRGEIGARGARLYAAHFSAERLAAAFEGA